mmetsp:Transcript_80652/g.139960  ORF Transcript_80652/g.139960 Transcript_80652/m.139960 type:complete len:325 (-) Transcript_80652:49-1023(-)
MKPSVMPSYLWAAAASLASLTHWMCLVPCARADRDGLLELGAEDTAASVRAALAALSRPLSKVVTKRSESRPHGTPRHPWQNHVNSAGAEEVSTPAVSLLSVSGKAVTQRGREHVFHGAGDLRAVEISSGKNITSLDSMALEQDSLQVDSVKSSHSPCGGKFGSLTDDYTTVVDLDFPNGCGNALQNSLFLHFAGGPECFSPDPENGCHRYVITRYNAGCNLSAIQSMWKSSLQPGDMFDKDGIYKKCKDLMQLESAETRYFSAPGVDQCSEALCAGLINQPADGNDDSAALPLGIFGGTRLVYVSIVLFAFCTSLSEGQLVHA